MSGRLVAKSGRCIVGLTLAVLLALATAVMEPAHAGWVGNDLTARSASGDGATNVFYSNFVGMPIDGTVDSVGIFNMHSSGSFDFFHLRPQSGGTAFQILSNLGTFVPNSTLSNTIQTFTFGSPVSVQAGDWFAHYGNGIPFSDAGGLNANNPHLIYIPVAASSIATAITNGTIINVNGSTSGFPVNIYNRDYASVVNLVELNLPITTDITPTYVAGTNYNRLVTNGTVALAIDGERWNYDAGAGNQQYMWFDLGDALLAHFTPGQQLLLDAKLRWSGSVLTSVGTPTVASEIGVFAAPDGNKGQNTVLTPAVGDLAVSAYYNSHLADLVDTVTATPGAALSAEWDITAMVQAWLDDPSDPLFGQFLLLQSATPMAVNWAAPGPTFLITTLAIPEPSCLALLLSAGLAGLLWWRRSAAR